MGLYGAPWVVVAAHDLKLPSFGQWSLRGWEMVRKWEGYVEGIEVKKERRA